jgi:peptidyl-prolyl cis-trans isomerase SurA
MRGPALAVIVAAALVAAAAPLPAQTPGPRQLVDRIIAVVGDRAILLSEVDEEINTRHSEGLQVPEDSAGFAELRRLVLASLIDDEVLYQRARRDTSLNVTDAEVQTAVEQQVRDVRARFSSDTEFRTQLRAANIGTVEEYRRKLSEEQRRAEYQRRYVDKLRNEGKLRGGPVSEAEIREAFAAMQLQAGQRPRPPTVTFQQIVVAPVASRAARAAARAQADSLLVELRHGADFATLARRHSDDPGSREQGGDLNWFRRGMMVRAFEDVAFGLRPGQISEVVETPFGYHIILVERIQPAEIKARHILIVPAIADSELAAAHRLADTVTTRLRGGASLDSLARLFADTSEPRQMGPVARSELPAPYVQAFEGTAPGEVVGPFAMNPDTPARSKFVVAVITDVQAERPFTFEEVHEQLRQSLQQKHALRDLYQVLRRQTYVEIRL